MFESEALGQVRKRVVQREQAAGIAEAAAQHACFVRFARTAVRRGQFLEVADEVQPGACKTGADGKIAAQGLFGTEIEGRLGEPRKVVVDVQRQAADALRAEIAGDGDDLRHGVMVVFVVVHVVA